MWVKPGCGARMSAGPRLMAEMASPRCTWPLVITCGVVAVLDAFSGNGCWGVLTSGIEVDMAAGVWMWLSGRLATFGCMRPTLVKESVVLMLRRRSSLASWVLAVEIRDLAGRPPGNRNPQTSTHTYTHMQ